MEKARSGVEAGRLYGGDWGSGGPERGAWKFSFSKPVICRFLPGIIAAAKTHVHQAASDNHGHPDAPG